MPRVIELIESEHGWTVTDSLRAEFANQLCPDEALWVVVQMLTGVKDLRYAKDYAGHVAWEERYCRDVQPPPVALLEDLRVREPVLVGRRMGRVTRTFDEQGHLVNRFIRLKGIPA